MEGARDERPDPTPDPAPGPALEEVLERCLEQPEAHWSEAVEAACETHPEHAAELRRRLARLRAAGLAPGIGARGERLGDYELERCVGEGAMGSVHLARHRTSGRRVAVKLLRERLAPSGPARQRFEREGELLARLDHPGLSRLLDRGEQDGFPFLVIEWIEGESLAQRLVRLPGPASGDELELRLAILRRTAEALETAHAAGLVHRDVKPANVMLRAGRDPADAPVLVDFGLARDLGESGTRVTATNALLGSPAYVPPEAFARLDAGAQEGVPTLDARSDVWGLGVTLHECVAGRLPFSAPTREALFHAIARGRAPALPAEPPAGFALERWRDLRAVLHTALERTPDRRYASAGALARDLAAVCDGRRVSVRGPGALRRAADWIVDHPWPSAFLALLAFGLLLASVALRRSAADLERLRALALADAAARADPERAVVLGRRAVEALDHPLTTSALQGALARYHRRIESEAISAPVVRAFFDGPGEHLLTLSIDRSARLWDREGRLLREVTEVDDAVHGVAPGELVTLHGERVLRWLTAGEPAVSRFEGKVLAARVVRGALHVVALDARGEPRWYTEAGEPTRLERPAPAEASGEPRAQAGLVARLSAQGRALLLCDGRSAWSMDDTGRTCAQVPARAILALGPRGDAFVVRDEQGPVLYGVTPEEGATLRHRFPPRAGPFHFYAGGERLAAVEGRRVVRLLAADGERLGTIPSHGVEVVAVDVSRDGRWVATGDGDGVVRLYRPDGGRVAELEGHAGHVTAVAFPPDAEWLASGSYDRRVRLFDLRPEHELGGTGANVLRVDARAGELLWVDGAGTLRVATEDGERALASGVRDACFAAGEHARLTIGVDGVLRGFDAQGSATELLRFGEEDAAVELAAAWDRSAAVLAFESGRVVVMAPEGAGWRILGEVEVGGPVLSAHLDARTRRVVVGRRDGRLVVVDLEAAEDERRVWRAHRDWIRSVRFDPAGERIVSASRDNSARLWSVEGEPIARLEGHRGTLARAVFSPDGEHLATASTDRTLRLWSAAGELEAELRGHRGQVWDVVFTPDGGELVSASFDGFLRRWPVGRERLLATARELLPSARR